MIRDFLEQAKADAPVYITDVRNAFLKEGTRPFHLQVQLYDGTNRMFCQLLPETKTEEEAQFAAAYIHAVIYNILSSLGAVRICIYTDVKDAFLLHLAEELDTVFQTALPKKERSGYGKCMNVNERICTTLFNGTKNFCFEIKDAEQMPEETQTTPKVYGEPVFAALPDKISGKMLLGIDIGGTDIKLAASVDGKLAVCKEYDWFPAAFGTAQEFIEPVLMLVRLMRDAAGLVFAGHPEAIDAAALKKDASAQDMQDGIRRMEEALAGISPEEPRAFDGIGLSFPDVVINNLIVGGETFKTKGMRENAAIDYDREFAKITGLGDVLKRFVRKDGKVCCTNDGPMAAFTAAVELAAIHEDVSHGFFAHTLGTELGTGWVRPDGSIPGIPLEVYNFIIDLGSWDQKQYTPLDVRSINNFNTSLPGTLQKYTSQYGVFRLAAKVLPSQDPDTWQEAQELGLIQNSSEGMFVPTAPEDMRKSALEFFMKKAADGAHPVCEQIFREIGVYLAVTWEETEYILAPEAKDRSLFGRLVKLPECFALLDEGAKERLPQIRQYAADSSLANTSLMKELDAHPDYTVAQFAQAVGAIFFACA